MAFASFLGRVLFVSIFVLSAFEEFNDFGEDGGSAAKILKPKVNALATHVHSYAGIKLPEVYMKHLVAAGIALKGMGGLLFIFESSLGAYLLLLHQIIATPILFDFYNYDAEEKEYYQLFIKFAQNMAVSGALLFFIGMQNSLLRRRPRIRISKTKAN